MHKQELQTKISGYSKKDVIDCLKKEGNLLGNCTQEFKNDFDVVITAVNQNGMAYAHASSFLRENENIIEAALKQNGNALGCMLNKYRENKTFVKMAILSNPMALDHAAPRFKGDRAYVKMATDINPETIGYASYKIKIDFNTVKPLLEKDGMILKLLATPQKDSFEFVDIATNQNPYAIEFASEQMRKNPYFLIKILGKNALYLSSLLVDGVYLEKSTESNVFTVVESMRHQLKDKDQQWFLEAISAIDCEDISDSIRVKESEEWLSRHFKLIPSTTNDKTTCLLIERLNDDNLNMSLKNSHLKELFDKEKIKRNILNVIAPKISKSKPRKVKVF